MTPYDYGNRGRPTTAASLTAIGINAAILLLFFGSGLRSLPLLILLAAGAAVPSLLRLWRSREAARLERERRESAKSGESDGIVWRIEDGD